MPRPLSFKKLDKQRKIFALARQHLEDKGKGELLLLRRQLREAMASLSSWLDTMARGKRRIRPQNAKLVEEMSEEVDDLEYEVAERLRDLEEEHRLHRYWENRLLPEPREGTIPTPDYPMLSPYRSANLIGQIDESWLPLDRFQSNKVGVAK